VVVVAGGAPAGALTCTAAHGTILDVQSAGWSMAPVCWNLPCPPPFLGDGEKVGSSGLRLACQRAVNNCGAHWVGWQQQTVLPSSKPCTTAQSICHTAARPAGSRCRSAGALPCQPRFGEVCTGCLQCLRPGLPARCRQCGVGRGGNGSCRSIGQIVRRGSEHLSHGSAASWLAAGERWSPPISSPPWEVCTGCLQRLPPGLPAGCQLCAVGWGGNGRQGCSGLIMPRASQHHTEVLPAGMQRSWRAMHTTTPQGGWLQNGSSIWSLPCQPLVEGCAQGSSSAPCLA